MTDTSVDEELETFKKSALDKCHSTPFKFEQDNNFGLKSEERAKIYDAFKESLQIWGGIRAKEVEGKYSEAFFLMHLYIRLVLHMQLHRKKESNFKKVSDQTLTNLKLIEGRLENCLNGVRRQFEMKHRAMAETRLKQKQKEEEELRETLRRREEEANLPQPSIVPPITPATHVVPPPVTQVPVAPATQVKINEAPPPAYPGGVSDPFMNTTIPTVSYPSLDGPGPVAPPTASVAKIIEKPKETDTAIDPWDKLSLSAFRVKQVSGDGNCAFRSIAQGMANGSLPQATETQQALALRKGVCKLLWQYRDKDLKGIGLTVEQLVTMDPESRHDSLRSYLNGMASSDYAGEVELILLANDLKSRIFVYQKDGGNYRRIASYGKGKRAPICLVWQKGLSESGNHYNSLLKN